MGRPKRSVARSAARDLPAGRHRLQPDHGRLLVRTRRDVPFLRTPTSCPGTPLTWGVDLDTYQHVGTLLNAESTTPAVEGCQYNPFDPSFAFVPSTQAPHAPTGVDATVLLDQDWGINGIAPADLRRASVTLPPRA